MQTILHDIFLGIEYFFKGICLLWHKDLRRFVLLPLLFNILFFVALLLLLFHYYASIDVFILAHLPSWLGIVSLLAKFVALVFYLIVMLYSFFTLATIIAAPFNGLLAEKVAIQRGVQLQDKTWLAILCDTPRLLGRQLFILLWYVPISLLLSILLLIPVIHVVVLLLWVWFHARMMALIYLDYPTDNAAISLKALRQWMDQHRALVFGFGSAVLFFSAIPVLNFFVIPASVIAATNLWLDKGGA